MKTCDLCDKEIEDRYELLEDSLVQLEMISNKKYKDMIYNKLKNEAYGQRENNFEYIINGLNIEYRKILQGK
jgi:hypothetical protein